MKSMTQYETILFPTDFSESADDALETALAVARAFGARLHVFHAVVLETPFVVPADGVVAIPSQEGLFADMDRHARAELSRIEGLAGDGIVEVTTEARRGDGTVDSILEVAAERGADLIVMSSHGRRGFRRLLVGSVAEELVRRARCPVLVIRRDPERESVSPSGRILAGIDFSPHSEQVLSTARSLAATLGRELDLIHVVHLPSASAMAVGTTPFGPVSPAPPESASYEERAARARELLEHTFETVGGPPVETRAVVRSGQPASEIVAHAEENDAGLVVVGTEGHSGVSRLLLGSVCERVLRRAPCPVFVVPHDDQEGS